MKNLYRQARRVLAKIWLEINLQLTVVGVTGSYGKTTTVNAIAKVLSAGYSVNKTDDNLDTLYNLPITILKTKIWTEVLVLEYGVDHLGEMAKHLSLVKPKIAVLTGITPVHSDEDHLGSLEKIIEEKTKLLSALPKNGYAVINYDDEKARLIGNQFTGRKIFYGLNKKADIYAAKIKITRDGTEFEIKDDSETLVIKTGILGYPAVYACLVAYIIGKNQNIKSTKIVSKLQELKPLKGRFNIEAGPLGTVLVNDSKRANLASTLAGLQSLAEFTGRKVAVLGEMGEIGDQEEEIHRTVGREAGKLKIDILVGVGPLTKFTVEEAKKNGLTNAFWVNDVQQAADVLKNKLKAGDLLYLKASLLRHLERIILLLNGAKVDCTKVSCHNYSPCEACSELVQ